MIVPREEFTCEACDHDYDTCQDAYECCGSPNITSRKWRVCSVCRKSLKSTDDTCCVTTPREEELRKALSNAQAEERFNRERCMMGYYDMKTKEAALALATYLARRKND